MYFFLPIQYYVSPLAEKASSCDMTRRACCPDGTGLNYTLPMCNTCKEKRNEAGKLVRTIPKLVPASPDKGR